MRCILVGNYGVGNMGDEALQDYFLQTFPHIEWTVVSANPVSGQLPRLPLGIRSFFTTSWWKTVWAFSQADAVVFGGGSLFTDVESVFACFLWFFHAIVARFFRKPVLLAFQGVGPFKTALGEWLACSTARHVDFLSVRDAESFQRVQNWNMNTKIIQTFDPVFSLMLAEKSTTNTKKLFSVIPRHNSSISLQKIVENVLKNSADTPYEEAHILLLQPDSVEEQTVAHTLEALFSIPVSLISIRTLNDLMREISSSSFVVTQRFHGALAALAVGIPQTIVPQKVGDKLFGLQKLLGDKDVRTQLLSLVDVGREALSQALRLS